MHFKKLFIRSLVFSLIELSCAQASAIAPHNRRATAMASSHLIITLQPDQGTLITDQIQHAIDSCAGAGGGTVHFPKGKFISGAVKLKSNITLQLDEGALLQGSDNFLDYGNGRHSDGFIYGDSITNIQIMGEGTIDGVDCTNPKGEEGFRGPHAIRLKNCTNIFINGITIIRSANWAINCRHCENIKVEGVKIRGGHDGLHTRFCKDISAINCDFRTGDDCFAGNDNENMVIKNCKVNTSCNGFRVGGKNVLIEDCKIWGPGEYRHIEQNRNNTISAFVYFSPKDEHPTLTSSNWVIRNVTIDHVDNFYRYNYVNGLWQTGMPLSTITFDNVHATDVKNAFTVIGDTARNLNMTLRNCSFVQSHGELGDIRREGMDLNSAGFFTLENFSVLKLDNVTFNTDKGNALNVSNGNKLILKKINLTPDIGKKGIVTEDIKQVFK